MNEVNNENLPKLFPGEKILLLKPQIKALAIYKWFLISFQPCPKNEIKYIRPKKKIIVTNKRIIISLLWETGVFVETFIGAQSCFYNQSDYEMYKKREGQDSVILKYETGEGKLFGKFIKLKIKRSYLTLDIKIYTDYNHDIKKIIQDYTK